MLKILILGSSGLLGRQIYETLKESKNFKLFHSGLKKRKINFENSFELKKFIFSKNPDLIINCIAYTNIEDCEKNVKTSKAINVGIVRDIFKIKHQKKMNFNFIHFSTDQFYNSRKNSLSSETSKIFLINKYCKHKRMSEIISLKNNALILRINFFGKSISKNQSFSDWIYKAFQNKKKLYLFDDVFFNPLRIKTISKLIKLIISKNKFKISGIFNLGAKDGIYKNQFSILFAKKTNIYHSNFVNVNVNKFLKVKRPTNMNMNINKFEKRFGICLPSIRSEIIKEAKEYIS